MRKTAGNILIFLGSGGLIVNAVQFLARIHVSSILFPISIALLVVGAVLIKYSRKAEQA